MPRADFFPGACAECRIAALADTRVLFHPAFGAVARHVHRYVTESLGEVLLAGGKTLGSLDGPGSGELAMSAHVLRGVFIRDRKTFDILGAVGRAAGAVLRWVRQTMCGLFGHDYFTRTSGNRIFLRCIDCDHETPGWFIDVRRPGASSAPGGTGWLRPGPGTRGRARAA